LSDVLRWKLMADGAGFYSDTDILYVKPVRPLIEISNRSDLILWYFDDHLAIEFLCAKNKNTFFRDVYRASLHVSDFTTYQAAGVGLIYRMVGMRVNHSKGCLAALRRRYPHLTFGSPPKHLLYPVHPLDTSKLHSRVVKLHPEAVGFHWYGGHPSSRKAIATLTTSNWRQYTSTSTFAYYLEVIGGE
ncbi:hypothetical protein D6833_13735, partial [Candidatus Parcubacteria bacterium]